MRKLFFASFLTLFILVTARGQESSGVKGVVVDKSSAPIVGVEVTLDNQKTGLQIKTSTNDQGEYQFLRVAPGPGYALTFVKEGFTKLEIMDIYLGVNSTSTRNATLEIGVITQSVEVRATGEQTLDTTDATIGNVFGTDLLHSLPIEFRDSPAALLGLQPGVVLAGNNDPSGNREGSVTGARADQGNITVDGLMRMVRPPARLSLPSAMLRSMRSRNFVASLQGLLPTWAGAAALRYSW